MPLIKWEISLDLTWSEKCIICSTTGKIEFSITDTKIYVHLVTLSTENDVKILNQLESGFKRTINWNKYHSTLKMFPQKIIELFN